MPYQLSPHCTVDDAQGLATCTTSAFWLETWWRLLWPADRTLPSLIEAIADRTPRNLLQMRSQRRHQKVVNSKTGAVVGYARWILPASKESEWLEAQTPDVDEAKRAEFKKRAEEADYEPRDDTEDMDDHVWNWRSKYDFDECLELDYLAVHPDNTRKGVGSMLVQSGVGVATELGLDVVVFAMGQHVRDLLVKAGFEVLEQESQDLAPYGETGVYETFYLIKRAPKKA